MSLITKVLPRNEHPIERALRVALGVAILTLFFLGPQSPWALLGIVPIVTGLLGSCPLYTLLGVSTCRMRSLEHARTKS